MLVIWENSDVGNYISMPFKGPNHLVLSQIPVPNDSIACSNIRLLPQRRKLDDSDITVLPRKGLNWA
jgi:hypothetical protein